MEAAMHDAPEEEGTTEEALDIDFHLMKTPVLRVKTGNWRGYRWTMKKWDPEADDGDDEWADLLESRTSLGDSGYLPDELFAQAATATTTRVEKPTSGWAKAVERKKRTRRRVRAKNLVIR